MRSRQYLGCLISLATLLVTAASSGAPPPPAPAPTVIPAPYPVTTDYISRFTSAGALDAAFGTGSWFKTASPVHAMTIDKAGRVLTFGSGTNNGVTGVTIARVMPGGATDAQFGTAGAFTSPVGGTAGSAPRPRGLEMDPSGRIVAGVDSVSAMGGMDPTIFRLLESGHADPTFGTGGKAVVKPPSATHVVESRFAVDSKGRILVAGLYAPTPAGAPPRLFLTRLKDSGVVDSSFASGGFAYVDLGGRGFSTARLLCDDQGRSYLVSNELGVNYPVAGTILQYSSAVSIRRFTDNGEPDKSFGTAGALEIRDVGINDGVIFREPAKNGVRLLLAGWGGAVATGAANDLYAVQIDENGALDLAFGQKGTFRTRPTNASLAAQVSRVLRTPRGQLILVGTAMTAGTPEVHLWRLDAQGSIDSSFGKNGAVGLRFGAPRAAVLDAQNRVVARGSAL